MKRPGLATSLSPWWGRKMQVEEISDHDLWLKQFVMATFSSLVGESHICASPAWAGCRCSSGPAFPGSQLSQGVSIDVRTKCGKQRGKGWCLWPTSLLHTGGRHRITVRPAPPWALPTPRTLRGQALSGSLRLPDSQQGSHQPCGEEAPS